MFAEPEKLILGLIIGTIFGFLLQKGRVAKYPVILGQFLFKDWTVAKIMGTAVAVGSIGVSALLSSGIGSFHVKPADLGGVLVGGVLFGTGMAILGYCPGTGVAAAGEGHKDALWGLGGMLTGAAAYVLAYPAVTAMVDAFPKWGKVTLAQVTSTSPWLWVTALVLAASIAYVGTRSRGESKSAPRKARTELALESR